MRQTKIWQTFSGKFEHSTTSETNSNLSIRNFVASYWPNKGTPGAQIKSMYDRIAHPVAESADTPATPATDPVTKTNGVKPEPAS